MQKSCLRYMRIAKALNNLRTGAVNSELYYSLTVSMGPKECIGRIQLGASCFTSHNEKFFYVEKGNEKGVDVKNRKVLHNS